MPVSDIELRKAKPREKPWKLFDGGGLYVLVNPNGSKWWRLKYAFDGREKLLALGVYPETPLKQARAGREEAKAMLAMGVDPNASRKQEKVAKKARALNTLELAARDWLAHRASEWTEGTLAAVTASLETHVFPTLGARPIAEVTSREIREAVKAVDAAGNGETARRVFQRLQSVFRWAISEELVEVDPTYPLKPAEMFREWTVTHRAAVDEREAPALLRKLDAYEGNAATRSALTLLILTALRPGELRCALWSEIDLDKAMWQISKERMKMKREHLVPLSTQAVMLLREIKKTAGSSNLVFPSPFYRGKPLSDGTLNSALARLGYKGNQTAHGFRTWFSTAANESGWPGDVIEYQLAHVERDKVRASYNKAKYLEKRRELMQWWADRIDIMRAPEALLIDKDTPMKDDPEGSALIDAMNISTERMAHAMNLMTKEVQTVEDKAEIAAAKKESVQLTKALKDHMKRLKAGGQTLTSSGGARLPGK